MDSGNIHNVQKLRVGDIETSWVESAGYYSTRKIIINSSKGEFILTLFADKPGYLTIDQKEED